MKKGLRRVIITAAGIVLFSNNFVTTTFADEIDSKLTTITNAEQVLNVQTKSEKLNSNKLTVIEREEYRSILSGNTAIIEKKDNLLTIDSENISEEELEIIKSSNSFYLFGTFKNDISTIKELENYEDNLYGETKFESAVEMANKNVERDIILVDGESIVDYFIATQLGSIEGKNVLLIGDELTPETKEYLVNHGSDKGITFLEGDSSINDETKELVMRISGAEKYEIGKSQLIKKVNKRESNKEKSPGHNSAKTVSILNEKLVDNESKNTANMIIENSKKITSKSKNDNDELLHNKGKVIAYEDLEESETNDEVDFTNFIRTVSEELESTDLLDDESVNDEVADGYSLQITKANPIEINSSIEEGKEEFIVPKETNDEIVQSVINGDYGNSEHRKQKLTQEGYNASEIQERIEEIVAEQRAQEQEAQAAEQARQAEANRQAEASREAQANNSSQGSSSSYVAPSTSTSSATPEGFINEALKMQGWTYSQSQRMQHGFVDCSSLVGRALANAGLGSSHMTTGSMTSDSRFYQVPMNQIKRGDVLWTSDHMEIYMGGNSTFGAFRPGVSTGYASNPSRFVRAYRLKGY